MTTRGKETQNRRQKQQHDQQQLLRPYGCEIEIAFPTAEHAEQAMRVLQVDREVSDRVARRFELVVEEETARCPTNEGGDGEEGRESDKRDGRSRRYKDSVALRNIVKVYVHTLPMATDTVRSSYE